MKHPVLETRRQVMREVVSSYPGGRECAASRLGFPLKKLDNHLYENAGSRPLTDEQIHQLEQDNRTTHLPDYIAALYGGVFVPVVHPDQIDNIDLYARSVKTAIKRGKVDQIIAAALEDGEIDDDEVTQILAAHYRYIAARVAEILAVIALHRKTPTQG